MDKKKIQNYKVIPVILAGGSGTRLWPLSRELSPKQVLRLSGNKSLLEHTLHRCSRFSKERPIIVTLQKQAAQLKSQVGERAILLKEPSAKNTAAAIALAANHISKEHKDSIMVILSADAHLETDQFSKVIKNAIRAAEKINKVVLVGIKPTRPETGYGYIKISKRINNLINCFGVETFVEKPDKKTALSYLASGNYLWNAGIFVSRTDLLMSEIEGCLPNVAQLFKADRRDAVKIYESLESISIDYGLLEKTRKIIALKADIDWNDLGSWGSVYDISPKDASGNYFEGNTVTLDTSNTMILNRGDRMVATIGTKETIIIDTEDVTLVCDKDRTQEIKTIVERIKNTKGRELIEHKTMQNSWGLSKVLENSKELSVRILTVNPGQTLPRRKSQGQVKIAVVRGVGLLSVNGNQIPLSAPQSYDIPEKASFGITNKHDRTFKVVETTIKRLPSAKKIVAGIKGTA